LVHNESAIHPSVSHYQFLDTKIKPTLEYQYEKNQWVFKLATIDGIHYKFDVKTGEILEPLPPKKSGEQQPSEG
jgi:hypothetical protein